MGTPSRSEHAALRGQGIMGAAAATMDELLADYLATRAALYGFAPDGASLDRLRTVGDIAALGLGVLAASPRTPGAGEVLSVVEAVNNTTTRATAATPASGNRIRLLGWSVPWGSSTICGMEIYFGTGANIQSDEAKAAVAVILNNQQLSHVMAWPDGAGPIGAVDDVLSVRLSAAVASTTALFTLLYREE